MKTKVKYRVETTYSKHDGGWYSTVYDANSGVDIWTTKSIYKTKLESERAAENYISGRTQ